MKHSIIISLFIIGLMISFGCNNSTTSQNYQTIEQDKPQDSLSLFKSSLEKFKKIGFVINAKINDTDLFKRWKEALQFNYTPAEAMYITLGNSKGYDPEIFYSDNCWHFDVKSIEGTGSYKNILDNISRISKGDIQFQNIRDYCNDNEDDKAWVSFTLNGDKYKWDLKVDETYVDDTLFDKIQELFKKYNKKGRLTYFSEGESCVFSYFTETEFDQFNAESGMHIDWLDKTTK